MHWLDGLSARSLARTPPRKRVFRGGWGDPEALAAYLPEAAAVVPIPDLPIAEGPEQSWDGLVGHDLAFDSPGRHLPAAARLARDQSPTSASSNSPPLFLASTWR